MPDSQLLNYSQNINTFGTVKSQTLDYGTPKSLPATLASDLNGTGITSYNFEVTATQLFNQITGPIFGSEFIRHPLHKGTKGILLSVDTDLGNMTGLGPSTASPTSLSLKPGNLNPALFIPVGNTDWEKVLPNHVVQYGIPPDPQATDQTYGTAHYDQVPSKSKGQKTFTNDGSGNVTHNVNIGPMGGTSLASHVTGANGIVSTVQSVVHKVTGSLISSANGSSLVNILSNAISHATSGNHSIQAAAHNVTAPTNITGNTSIIGGLGVSGNMTGGGISMISGLLSAIGGAFGSSGVASTGPITGTSLAVTGPVSAQLPGPYANDTAAAAGGVPINGQYYNHISTGVNYVQIRIS